MIFLIVFSAYILYVYMLNLVRYNFKNGAKDPFCCTLIRKFTHSRFCRVSFWYKMYFFFEGIEGFDEIFRGKNWNVSVDFGVFGFMKKYNAISVEYIFNLFIITLYVQRVRKIPILDRLKEYGFELRIFTPRRVIGEDGFRICNGHWEYHHVSIFNMKYRYKEYLGIDNKWRTFTTLEDSHVATMIHRPCITTAIFSLGGSTFRLISAKVYILRSIQTCGGILGLIPFFPFRKYTYTINGDFIKWRDYPDYLRKPDLIFEHIQGQDHSDSWERAVELKINSGRRPS